MSRRVSALREALSVVQGLGSAAPFNHRAALNGLPETVYVDAIVRPPAPARLLVGGIAPKAIASAGELADGWTMAPFGSLEDFAHGWQLVRYGATTAGRDPEKLVAGHLIYVCADPQAEKAHEELPAFLHYYYGDLLDVGRDGMFGTAHDVANQLQLQVEAGITHLMLGAPNLDLEHLEYLADAFIPQLRGLSAD